MSGQNQMAKALRQNGVPVLGQPQAIPLVAVVMISQQVLDEIRKVVREEVEGILREKANGD